MRSFIICTPRQICVIRVVNSSRMRWTGHIICVDPQTRNYLHFMQPSVHYCIHKNLTAVLIHSYISPVHQFKVSFIITLHL